MSIFQQKTDMEKRCESVLRAVEKKPGKRLRWIASDLPYSDSEVRAALNKLWREGRVSRHQEARGNFRFFKYYPAEKR